MILSSKSEKEILRPTSNSLKNMAKAEDIKMLTPSDIKNINNFENLKEGHKRTFKHRLIKKFRQFQEDLEVVLLHYEKMNIKVDKIIDINQLIKLLKLYEDLCLLQHR